MERKQTDYDIQKTSELFERVNKELKIYEDKNLLEIYAIYMARVQTYELSLKSDLEELFEVPEDKIERMNLASILRFYEKKDIRAHPILYANLTEISKQRNSMAHEILAAANNLTALSGDDSLRLIQKDFMKFAYELELAFQQYLMLKEDGQLYKDWGIKASYPFPNND